MNRTWHALSYVTISLVLFSFPRSEFSLSAASIYFPYISSNKKDFFKNKFCKIRLMKKKRKKSLMTLKFHFFPLFFSFFYLYAQILKYFSTSLKSSQEFRHPTYHGTEVPGIEWWKLSIFPGKLIKNFSLLT